MGGDTFEGVQKLTNEQYESIVPEIMDRLKNIYVRIESYIALPQKTIHGDIDYLIILKEGIKPKDIIDTLQMEKFLINNNDTINSVYKNKQVDFCIVNNDQDFENFKFYKSYGGIGAYLGTFLSSKEIKLTTKGLYAVGFEDHIKFQFLITRDIKAILQFYGMSYEDYQKGFKTRLQYFQYLRTCRFLKQTKMAAIDIQNMPKTKLHSMGKLNRQFIEYLQTVGLKQGEAKSKYQKPRQQTLQYFHKQAEFQKQFEQLLESINRKKNLNKKFNASDLMKHFGIPQKQLNKYKKIFHYSFPHMDAYYQFVQDNSLQQILQYFRVVSKMDENIKIEQRQEKVESGEKEETQKSQKTQE